MRKVPTTRGEAIFVCNLKIIASASKENGAILADSFASVSVASPYNLIDGQGDGKIGIHYLSETGRIWLRF